MKVIIVEDLKSISTSLCIEDYKFTKGVFNPNKENLLEIEVLDREECFTHLITEMDDIEKANKLVINILGIKDCRPLVAVSNAGEDTQIFIQYPINKNTPHSIDKSLKELSLLTDVRDLLVDNRLNIGAIFLILYEFARIERMPLRELNNLELIVGYHTHKDILSIFEELTSGYKVDLNTQSPILSLGDMGIFNLVKYFTLFHILLPHENLNVRPTLIGECRHSVKENINTFLVSNGLSSGLDSDVRVAKEDIIHFCLVKLNQLDSNITLMRIVSEEVECEPKFEREESSKTEGILSNNMKVVLIIFIFAGILCTVSSYITASNVSSRELKRYTEQMNIIKEQEQATVEESAKKRRFSKDVKGIKIENKVISIAVPSEAYIATSVRGLELNVTNKEVNDSSFYEYFDLCAYYMDMEIFTKNMVMRQQMDYLIYVLDIKYPSERLVRVELNKYSDRHLNELEKSYIYQYLKAVNCRVYLEKEESDSSEAIILIAR